MSKYGKKASVKVERAMDEMKKGTLKTGRSGKKVTNPKQAVAIGLSEARKVGGKVSTPTMTTKTTPTKTATTKTATTKTTPTKKTVGTKTGIAKKLGKTKTTATTGRKTATTKKTGKTATTRTTR